MSWHFGRIARPPYGDRNSSDVDRCSQGSWCDGSGMTVHEACEVLGVRAGAYLEEIEAAYREQCSKRQACSSIA